MEIIIDNEIEEQTNLFLNELEKNVDIYFHERFVLPGDDITEIITKISKEINIGTGLKQINSRVICELAGILKYREPKTYWIEQDTRKYIPRTGDQIIGIIEEKTADYYRVNIFSGSPAILNRLAFEGATKRNKPELKVGDVIYCRVSLAHRDLDTELTCISSTSNKKNWSSGESIYGELSDGVTVELSIKTTKNLLKSESIALNVLGKYLAFEAAIGMNGVVWFKSSTVKESIVIRNALINSQNLDSFQTEAMIELLVQRMKRI